MRVYLDICCLKRPFDDLTQDRVRLESIGAPMALGFKSFDALHLASAEISMSHTFVTVDDRLLGAARRQAPLLRCAVREPITFAREVLP